MKKFYDKWLSRSEEKEIVQPASYYRTIANEIRNACKRYQHKSSYTFLDFGAGWGDWSIMAKAFGAEVYALELSEEKKQHLSSNGINVLTWEDIATLKFDFVNTEQVFEHISQPQETLKYLSRSLTGEGVLKISVPNGTRVKKNLRNNPDWFAPRFGSKSLMPIQPLEHINCFPNGSIDYMARQNNLTRIKLNPVSDPKNVLDLSFRDVLLPMYKLTFRKYTPTQCHYFQMNGSDSG